MNIIQQNLQAVKRVSKDFSLLSHKQRNNIIGKIGEKILERKKDILQENRKDLEKMGKENPLYDRLLLDEYRIEAMINGCKKMIKISDPLELYSQQEPVLTDDGLEIKKQAIPLGVIACIYEARPNVTIDIAIMCIKSGNAVVLRGGSQAQYSNSILISLIQEVLEDQGFSKEGVYNYPSNRADLEILYRAINEVDVIIPRGSRGLIESVREKSLVPVIETGAGVVHLYLDSDIEEKNIEKAKEIILNAKVSRPSVCNALDTLIIHKEVSQKFVDTIYRDLEKKGVKIYSDEKTLDYYKEFLGLGMNIKFVNSIKEAISHIQTYSTLHSDGIISDSAENIQIFQKMIDSSVVYVNTSTRFSDGECFGFGGEVGISTQKLHARGPMGATALVSYKYIVKSEYLVR